MGTIWGRARRKRRRYPRRSRAAPKTGWTAQQLGAWTGVSVHAIRSYVKHDVMPSPIFRASATRYQRAHLIHLLAIRRLRVTEKLSLTAIRARLQALSSAELEAFATAGLAPGPLADALGIRAIASMPPNAGANASRADLAGANNPLAAALPRWSRVELALGVELHVRDDASPRVIELVHQFTRLCQVNLSEPETSAASSASPSPPRA